MGYNSLSSSGMTGPEMRAEASRIVKMFSVQDRAKMTPKEQAFITRMYDATVSVSTAQLFWLRDLKSKYVE